MRISDWSSDVCSSDLQSVRADVGRAAADRDGPECGRSLRGRQHLSHRGEREPGAGAVPGTGRSRGDLSDLYLWHFNRRRAGRSEEHTSELQSLMRISYAVFCLKTTTTNT